MSLWRTELVSSTVALYVSWVDHRDVLVWTLSGRQIDSAKRLPTNILWLPYFLFEMKPFTSESKPATHESIFLTEFCER